MGVSVFNILGNLVLVIFDSAVEGVRNCIDKVRGRRVRSMIKDRRANRERIAKKLPGVFSRIE